MTLEDLGRECDVIIRNTTTAVSVSTAIFQTVDRTRSSS